MSACRMPCATVTMPERAPWRKTVSRRVTAAWPDSMRSPSTLPAPTDGSWLTSPTSSRWAVEGIARSRAAASLVSSMLDSSMMTKSACRGSSAVAVKPPSAGSNLSRRWMVEAGRRVASVMRLAARPVGAPSAMRVRLAERMSHRARRIVVLPVPGPPVSTATLCCSAIFTPAACASEKAKPARVWAHSTALSTWMVGSPLGPARSRRTEAAIDFSAFSCGRSCMSRTPFTSRKPTACSSSKRRRRSWTTARSTSSSSVAFSSSPSSGKALWPSPSSSSSVCSRPASTRCGPAVGRPRLRAILSAVLKPTPSTSRQTR